MLQVKNLQLKLKYFKTIKKLKNFYNKNDYPVVNVAYMTMLYIRVLPLIPVMVKA